jgi:hypothetical protein
VPANATVREAFKDVHDLRRLHEVLIQVTRLPFRFAKRQSTLAAALP